MKAKFITKAGRVGYFILFLILVAAEIGSIYIALTDFIDEASIFAVASVVWIVPAILCLLTAIFSVGAELTLERGKLIGRWRGREFSCLLSDVKMLYCNNSEKGGDYLYLRTSEGSYHFFGMRNAEEMRGRIVAELPLPADCKNASDDLLQTKLQEKKRIAAKWNGLTAAVAIALVAVIVGGLFALAKHLHLLIALSCAAIAVIAAICLIRISGIAEWHKRGKDRLKKEFNRRKIGNIDEYPKGYTDVVKVIYYLDYEARLVVCRTDDGYTLTDEYWEDEGNPPVWMKDEDYAVVTDADEDDLDEDDLDEEEPHLFATMEELDDYLQEEYAILGFDETVYFD